MKHWHKTGCNAHLTRSYTLTSWIKREILWSIGLFRYKSTKKEKKKRKLPDFVEAGDDVAEVNPGCPRFCHLVKQVIPEKLQQVSVACFWPRWVLLEPDHSTTQDHRIATETQKTHYDATFNLVVLTLAVHLWCPVWPASGRDGHFAPPAINGQFYFKSFIYFTLRSMRWCCFTLL